MIIVVEGDRSAGEVLAPGAFEAADLRWSGRNFAESGGASKVDAQRRAHEIRAAAVFRPSNLLHLFGHGVGSRTVIRLVVLGIVGHNCKPLLVALTEKDGMRQR